MAATGVGGLFLFPPRKFVYLLSQILHLHTFLKEIKLVEKVDFPQYINIWYIFLDLKKK
jgi:hypothetical protein